MMYLVADFTIEPFEPSAPGPHVLAAIAVAEAGASEDEAVTVDVGPFGTTIRGPAATVLELVSVINGTAIERGATRVSLQLTVTGA